MRGRLAVVVAAVLGVAAIATSALLMRGHASSGAAPALEPEMEPEAAFQSRLKVGDEVFAVEPDIVIGVDYQTRERRVSAERPSPSDPFVVSVSDARGRELERCPAGKAWDAVLPALSSVRALRVLPAAEARALWGGAGKDAALLRVRDTIAGDPTQFRVVARREGDVVLRDAAGVFVSSVPQRVLRVLAAGCARVD